MSTLRNELKFLDTILNKVNRTESYLVLKESLHNVWVIDIEGKQEPKEIPKRMINLAFIKVDPKVIKILYGDTNDQKIDTSTTSVDEVK